MKALQDLLALAFAHAGIVARKDRRNPHSRKKGPGRYHRAGR